MKTSITSRIFEFLERENIAQSQLARTVGITRANITEWKSGASQPSPKVILKILFHFPEIDANWLIRGSTNININDSSQHQKTTGKQSSNTISNISGGSTELEFLRETIKDKNEQITFLRDLLKNK